MFRTKSSRGILERNFLFIMEDMVNGIFFVSLKVCV